MARPMPLPEPRPLLQPLAGITPSMLLWWFRHIGDEVHYAGERMSGYLAWHPLDHIAWELARPAPGGGPTVFQLEHTWSWGPDGAHYVSVMDLGSRLPMFAPVNHHLTTRVFPLAMAWVRHNIEEVGVLEHLLPDILRQRPGEAAKLGV